MTSEFMVEAMIKYYKTKIVAKNDIEDKLRILHYVRLNWHPDKAASLGDPDITSTHTGITQWANATTDDLRQQVPRAAAASGADGQIFFPIQRPKPRSTQQTTNTITTTTDFQGTGVAASGADTLVLDQHQPNNKTTQPKHNTGPKPRSTSQNRVNNGTAATGADNRLTNTTGPKPRPTKLEPRNNGAAASGADNQLLDDHSTSSTKLQTTPEPHNYHTTTRSS